MVNVTHHARIVGRDEGREWSQRVDTVIRDGRVVARDHEVLSGPGDGTFLARPLGIGNDR